MGRRGKSARSDSLTPVQIEPGWARRFRAKLLAWYDRNRRDLPWRHTSDPYAVWISEAMLQQTQVATVIPYYERFLSRFPTVRELAEAAPDDVLRLWAGLGYYARARSLHRAAQVIVEQHDGRFPPTVDELRTLPGIGPYTAGAIASIAFGRRAAVVDGNVARVLSRALVIENDVGAGSGRERIWDAARRLTPSRRCGDYNQALMELGARICTPGASARCAACPVRVLCGALREDRVAELPARMARTPVRTELHVLAAIQFDGRWLFVRRPARGLWGGLWSLPYVERSPAEQAGDFSAEDIARQIAGGLGFETETIRERPFVDMTCQLTHRTIRLIGFVCRPTRQAKPRDALSRGVAWRSLERVGDLGMSTAIRKTVEALKETVATESLRASWRSQLVKRAARPGRHRFQGPREASASRKAESAGRAPC